MAKKTESNINWKQVMERARRSDNQALYGNSSGSRAVEPYTPRQQQTEQTGRFDWTAIMKTAKEQDGRGTSTPWVKTYTSGGREAAPAASGGRPSQSAARGTYSPTLSRYKAQGGVTFEQYKAAVDSITQQRYRAMRGMTEEQYRQRLDANAQQLRSEGASPHQSAAPTASPRGEATGAAGQRGARGGFGKAEGEQAVKREQELSGKVSEQEFNRSTAMQQKYGSYQNYLRGVYAGYDEAMENARRAKQEQAQREGKVTEQEFNRSTAMQQKYGTYQNYLNSVTTTTDEQTRYQAQNARLDNLGIREDVARYFELDADEDREEKDALRQRFDEMGVTGKDLSDFRALLKNPKLAGDYVGFGEAAADAFISGSSASWLGGQEATHAVAEAGVNKAAAWALRDLAKSKVLGGIFGQEYRDSLNALADKLATDIDWSGAQAWQDEYSRIMERATKDRSAVGKFVVENLPSVGSMLLDAGLAGMSGVNPIKETTNLSTLTSMASRAGGNAAVDAKNAGATDGEAILIGLENAAVEVFSEKLFGGNPVYDEDVGLINRAAAKLKNKTLLRVLDSKAFGLVSEGLEEVVAELLEPTFQSLVLDGTLEGTVTAEDLGMSFLGGVFVGVLGDAAGMVSGLSQARQDRYMKQYAKILIRETGGSTNADVQAARDTISDKLAYGRAPDMQDFGRLIDALDKAGESDAAERTVEEVQREASESDVPENMDVEDGDIPSNMDVIDEDGDGLPDNMELEADERQVGNNEPSPHQSASRTASPRGEAMGASETATSEPEVRTILRQAGQEDVRGRVKGDKLFGKVGDTLRQYKARLKEYDARTAELRGLEGANAQQVRNNEPSPHQSPTATASPRGEADGREAASTPTGAREAVGAAEREARVQELREQIAQDEAYLEAKERDMQDVASVARARLENERQQKELGRETQTLSDKELRETEQSAQAQESAAELAARRAAEEQDAAELERIAKRNEYSFAMTQYFISGYFDANDRVQMDIPTYAEAVRVAYGKGRFGWKFKREDLQRGIADEVLQEAYKEGRRKGEENGTAGISNGGERDAGMDSDEPSGRVGRGAGGAEKESAGGFGVKESLRIQSVLGTAKAERLSPKADGIENGSEQKMFYRVPEETVQEYPALKQAKQILTDAGADDVRLVSGSIRIRTAGGREMSVQGVTQGTTVWLTIDAKDGVIKTAEHEAMHLRMEAESGLRERLIDALGLSQEQRDKLARKYCEAYEGCYTGEDMSAYLDEIVCDAYAGINRMGLGADKLQSSVRAAADSTASQRTKKPAQTRGPPARNSVEAKERQYEGVNLAKDGSVYTYEFLTSLPDMSVTMLPAVDAVRGNDERVDTAKVVRAGMKNASTIGTERDGKVFVRNDYTGRELRIDTASIRHGLNGSLNRLLTNARLGANIGAIVKNAVPINALRNKASDVTGTYAMAAYAADRRGREFVAIITVEQRSGNVSGVSAYDVAHAVSGRQKNGSQADTKSQGVYPIKAATISIKDFLGIVNSTHQSILPQDVLTAFKETRNPKGEYAEKAKFSPAASPKENDKTALAYFGKTYKWSETGYVLLDGSKLDFSGRHEGGAGGYRSVDHRDISDAFDGELGDGSYTGGMVQFMQEGNIRISPESGGINLAVMPTRAQMDSLSDFISRERGEVILDIDDENGNTLSSTEYPKGTHANKVLQDIRNYFQSGQTPQVGSEPTVQQFRLSPEMQERAPELTDADAPVLSEEEQRQEIARALEENDEERNRLRKLQRTGRQYMKQVRDETVRKLTNPMSAAGWDLETKVRPEINKIIDEYIETGKVQKSTVEQAFETTYREAKQMNDEFARRYSEVLDVIKSRRIVLSDDQKLELQNATPEKAKVLARSLRDLKAMDFTKGAQPLYDVSRMYAKVHKMAPELFGTWAKESWEQITRLSSVSRQIMKATVLSEKMETAEFKEHAWDSFKAGVKEMRPELRKARDYAQEMEREQAAAREEMLRREEETAREDERRREEEAAAEQDAFEPYDYGKLPGKARAFVDQAVNSAVRQAANAMSIPGKAKREVLKPAVQGMMNEFLQTGRIAQETIDKSFEDAYDAGIEEDREFYDTFKHIKGKLLKTGVRVTPEVRAEFADLEQFRRAVRGRILLNNEGIGIDTLYGELHDEAPGLFPEAIMNPADQLMRMIEVANKIQITKQTLDEAHKGDGGDYKRWARNDFEAAVEDMKASLRTARAWAESRERTKLAQEAPKSQAEVEELYKRQREARRAYERVQSRNLLTDEDERILDRLLRGELAPEDIQDRKNARSILNVYEAKADYAALTAQIARWRRGVKEGYREQVRPLLTNSEQAKDKKGLASGFRYDRETAERNIEDVFPAADAKRINETIFEPVHTQQAKSTRFKNEYRARVRKLDLSRKVKAGDVVSEAHAVQLYGEAMDNIRQLTKKPMDAKRDGKTLAEWEAVVRELWEKNPGIRKEKVERAVGEFRRIYDELFTQMNDVRVRNGYEPIDYRKGYFPHFQPGQTDGVLAVMGKALGIRADVTALPTTINGLTHTFKPGITWFGNARERLGFNTAYDAVEGFDKYIEGAADIVFQTDNIQRLRAFASEVRYRTSNEGVRERVDAIRADESISEQDKELRIKDLYENAKFELSGFAAWLDEYTNLLANKKSKLDRGVESVLGRGFYNAMSWLESRAAANMVAMNPGSWLTNFIPLTQAWGYVSTGDMVQAMGQTIAAMKNDDGFWERSAFLTNRRGSDPLVRTWQGNLSAKLSMPMEWIDTFTADTIVRARYNQNLRRGMLEEDAMREADRFAANIMADRSKGATPTMFQSRNPFVKLFTQFQLEVNNQFSNIFKDLPREMRKRGLQALAWALFKMFFSAWAYNELYEKVVGRRAALDPIDMTNELVGDATGYKLNNVLDVAFGSEAGFIHEGKPAGFGNTVTNFLTSTAEELPLAGGVLGGGRVPFSSALPDVSAIWKAATNKELDSETKNAKLWEEVRDPLLYLGLPFGGGEVRKVSQGVYAVAKGGKFYRNNKGELQMQYPVFTDEGAMTVLRAVQAGVFGRNATKEARDWVQSGFSKLSTKETNAYLAMSAAEVKQREAWKLIQAMKDVDVPEGASEREAKLAALNAYDIADEAKALYYYNVMASEKEQAMLQRLLTENADVGAYLEYRQALPGADGWKDAEGNTVSGSKKSELYDLLDSYDFTPEQKDAIAGESYKLTGFEPWTEQGKSLREAAMTGKNVTQVVRELKKAGYTNGEISQAITALCRQDFREASERERIDLRAHLATVYAMLGKDRKKALEKIDEWVQ